MAGYANAPLFRTVMPPGVLYYTQGGPAQQDKQKRCRNECTAPSPVLNRPGMGFTARHVQAKLTERPEINIHEEPRCSPDGSPNHVDAEWNSG